MSNLNVGTIGLGRLNEELRRWKQGKRIVPNEQSIFRLTGALLMETNEGWLSWRQ